jgi:ribosome-binding protein aMBF1 (putative translation factor)
MNTIHTPNCWICGRAVSLGNSKIDENHLAVHESCYLAKMALENEQSQPSTVAKEGRSQPSRPQKPTT